MYKNITLKIVYLLVKKKTIFTNYKKNIFFRQLQVLLIKLQTCKDIKTGIFNKIFLYFYIYIFFVQTSMYSCEKIYFY